jgi:hypothetical protein
MSEPKVPITRLSRWFSDADFQLQQAFSREYIESQGFVVVLYRVNRSTSQSSDVYGEGPNNNSITYFPPVELVVSLNIEAPENKNYDKNSGGLRYNIQGKLIFDIFTQQLEQLGNISISYGDYIKYNITEDKSITYVISDDNVMNFDSEHSIFGYKPAYRTVICTPVDESEFLGL